MAIGKVLVGAQALLFLLPATLLVAFLLVLSLPTYPPPLNAPQIAFDLGLAVVILGLAAAWRLTVGYLRHAAAALRKAHRLWLVLLVLGALVGLAGAVVTALHLMDPVNPGVSVGYALLAPGALLAPLAVLLLLQHK